MVGATPTGHRLHIYPKIKGDNTSISVSPNFDVFAVFQDGGEERYVPVVALVQNAKGFVQGIIINEDGAFEIPKLRPDFLYYETRAAAR